MTSRIWFIQNITHETPGLFACFVERMKIPFTIVDLHQEEKFPDIPKSDVAVILGGPDSANDRSQKILDEIDAIQRLLKEGIPCLGICLGLQLLVKAAGGTVLRNSVPEVGFRGPDGQWFEIEKTKAGQSDPLLLGVPDSLKLFQLHNDTVSLTPSMTRLAQGDFCAEQIVKIHDKAYGIQGHVELSETMFADMLKENEALGEMDSVKLRNDFSLVRKELAQSSETIFKNFLTLGGFFARESS